MVRKSLGLPVIAWAIFATLVCVSVATYAQGPVGYRVIKQTVYDSQPATVSRWVNETVYETRQVTTYKRVFETETRYRRTSTLKPVTETSTRRERYTVTRPVYETTYNERQVKETTYEDVTEMREQRYLVRKPVVETQFREERVVVRKPVTQQMLKTENVTTYRPVQTTNSDWVPSSVVSNQTVLDPRGGRARLQWLDRGTYVDPATGRSVYRRPGLHWVQQPALRNQQVVSPVMVLQQNTATTYVPETIQRKTPVEITSYVDQVETRRIPYQIQKIQESYEVHKIPVAVRKPVITYRTEKVPVQTLKYQEEVRYRDVPETKTTWQRVTRDEPYQVQVSKLVPETREVRVPKTVARRVDCEFTQSVPRTVLMKVPVDQFGCVVGPPVPVDSRDSASSVYLSPNSIPAVNDNQVVGSSTVVGRAPITESADSKALEIYRGSLLSKKQETTDWKSQNTEKPHSVLSPQKGNEANSAPTLVPIQRTPDPAKEAGQAAGMEPDAVEIDLRKVESDASKVNRRSSPVENGTISNDPPELNGPDNGEGGGND